MKELIMRVRQLILDNLLFSVVWGVALITVLVFNFSFKAPYTFVGITDSEEVSISSKSPVNIKQVVVLPGQKVRKGQLLVELERPDLVKKINEVEHKLAALKNELSLNEKLNKNLKSIKGIEGNDENTLTIEIKSLQKELELLQKDQEELFIFANFNGHIGTINFKNGENVSPFTPILSIHKKTPTLVKGYIHENISRKIQVGSEVKVTDINGKSHVKSVVKNVGTRIVELPERFLRQADQKVWGREVVVSLPENNEFLLGEKVYLELTSKKMKKRLRMLANSKVGLGPVKEISGSMLFMYRNKVEPSGVLYDKRRGSFLLISDDTVDNRPLIYQMSQDGVISSETLEIVGINKIKDMEAITQDELGDIYVCTSHSEDKEGDIPQARRRLVQLSQKLGKLVKIDEIDILEQLNAIAKEDSDQEWVELLRNKKKKSDYIIDLDIEGISFLDDKLLIGLRNNVGAKDEVVILEIMDIKKSFKTDKITTEQVGIWSRMELPVESRDDLSQGISDLYVRAGKLYMTVASNKHKHKGGRVLVVDIASRSVEKEVIRFENKRPEGITYNPLRKEFVIVFDSNDGENISMVSLKL